MKQTVLISISRGFVVRDLVISGAIHALLKQPLQVVLLTHERHLEDLRRRFQSERVHVEPFPLISQELGIIEKKLTNAGFKLYRSPACVRLLARLNHFLWKASPTHFFKPLFDRYQPDLVMSGTPGFHTPVDAYLIREAKQRSIPTLSVIPSWDNLFTRGILPSFPDRLAVWNDRVKSDYVQTYHFPKETVRITGPLQFDFYFDPSLYVSRSEFFRENGLDEGKKLITVALSRSELAGSPDYLLSSLEQAYERGAFLKPVQFVCRLHPVDRQLSKETFSRYRIFRFEHFNQRTNLFGWCPDEAEIRHKANLLKHSDVVVSYYSTFGIEGVLSGRPVIHVAFHNEKPEAFERLRASLYDRHFRYLKDTTAIRSATSESSLIDWINRYLESPQLDAQARQDLAERFCFKLDGKAHQRLADCAWSLLKDGNGI